MKPQNAFKVLMKIALLISFVTIVYVIPKMIPLVLGLMVSYLYFNHKKFSTLVDETQLNVTNIEILQTKTDQLFENQKQLHKLIKHQKKSNT